MSTWMRRPALWICVLLLAGCANPLVKPGPQTVDGLTLDTPLAWTDYGLRGERLWTRDGVLLNALRIYTDIRPGEHVFRERQRNSKREEGARYRAASSAVEIQEVILEALRADGLANVAAEDLRPATLAGRSGFRFQLRFDSEAGLHYRGLVLGEGADDTLSFLIFTAPSGHYYEHLRGAVEAIYNSVR